MKRASCFLLALILIVPMCLLSAEAKKESKMGDIAISCTQSGFRGDEFTLTVALNANPGVTSIRLPLDYDRDYLEIVSAKDLGVFPGAMFTNDVKAKEFYLYWANNLVKENITKIGEIAKVVFRVKDTAPIGETTIRLGFKEKTFDIIDANLEVVPFSANEVKFNVTCRHDNLKENILWNATFDLTGKKEIVCQDCGQKIEEKILPVLQSQGGVSANVQAGEFSFGSGENYIEPTLTYVRLTSGEEYEAAMKLYPNLTAVFQIKFTKNGADYVPVGKTEIKLEDVCEFSMGSHLFVLNEDGTCTEVEATKLGKILTFEYRNATFFVAEDYVPDTDEDGTPDDLEPVSPTVEVDADSVILTRSQFIIICAVAALVFFGMLGISFLPRFKKEK